MRHSISAAARRLPAALGAILVVYALLAPALIWYSEHSRIVEERAVAASVAAEQALAVQMGIEHALSATYALASMVKLNKGDVPDFEMAAAVLRSYYPGISALQLAPDGIIRRIAPLARNEKALGHDLLKDPERDKEAFLARDTGKLTLAGPFPLVQGGLGAAGRLPVYLSDKDNQPRFWGFVIVLIRFPEALDATGLPLLTGRGYHYEVWRTHPDTGARHVIAASSAEPLNDPVEHALRVPNVTWTLGIAPARGWIDRPLLAAKIGAAVLILILLAALRLVARRRTQNQA